MSSKWLPFENRLLVCLSAVACFPHHGLGCCCSDSNIDSDRNVPSSLSRGKNVAVVLVNLVARIPTPTSLLTRLTDMIVLLTAVIFMTDKKKGVLLIDL